MAAETTVGSIVGYLRLNDEDWSKTIAQAKADIRSLDSQRVNVPVKADADQAKRDLKETAAEADALDRKRVDVKVSTDKSRKEMNLLGTAIAALAPATIPVGVAAVGMGAAFAGMGATAALAVYGIKQEMASGTAVGQAYSQVVADLKGDLDGLGHTAAAGSLTAVQQVVAVLAQEMPGLNREVGGLASITGDVMVPAVRGLITGLQTATPLLLAGGAAARDMAQQFNAFAQSQGFASFVSYAAANLPRVIDDVEQIAAAAVRLGAAFAPMGMTTLSTLRLVADVLNGLPIGVLQTLATTATGVYIAFQSWRGLSGILGDVSGAFDKIATKTGSGAAGMLATATASGGASLAVGGLGAALGVATIAWGLYEQQQAEARAAVQDMTSAIIADNGALGANTDAKIANNVASGDMGKWASQFGVSMSTVTGAIRGNTDDMNTLTASVTAQDKALAEHARGYASTDGYQFIEAVKKQAGVVSDAKDQAGQYSSALDSMSSSSGQAAQAQQTLATANLDVATATDDQRKAIDQLNAALDREISKNTTLAGGQLGVAQATADMVTQLKKSKDTTDLNSQAGRDNQRSILGAVTQLQQYRDTLAKTSGSSAEATSQYESMGRTLLAQIAKTDGANSAAYKYAQQLLAIPSDVNTKLGLDDNGALTAIGQIQAALAGIPAEVTTKISVVKSVQNLYSTPAQGKTAGAMWDSGGYTGPGGKFQPAGIVHAGEVVFSQEDVAAHGGPAAVDSYRKSRRSYAGGGIVGYASGGAVSDYDLSDIFALVQSMAVDPSKLSSAKDSVGSAGKRVASARSAVGKVLASLAAAERQQRLAQATKSKKDDITAAARVNKLLIERSDAYRKLADAQKAAGAAQSSYNALVAASKMSAGQLFVKASGQNNAVNQTFLNDLMKIRALGFPVIALQLLNQGDEEAMKTAHSFASGPLAQLVSANANLQKSGQLQGKLDALKNDLNGSSVSAARDSNAQRMALIAANNQLRVGSQTIVHSGVTADQVKQIITQVVQQIPSGDIYMDSEKVGRRVAGPVTRQQGDDFRRSSTRPF